MKSHLLKLHPLKVKCTKTQLLRNTRNITSKTKTSILKNTHVDFAISLPLKKWEKETELTLLVLGNKQGCKYHSKCRHCWKKFGIPKEISIGQKKRQRTCFSEQVKYFDMRSIISYCPGISKLYNIETHPQVFQDCKILSCTSLHTSVLTSPLRDLFATLLVSKHKPA